MEADCSFNVRKLKAVWKALFSFGPNIKGRHVLVLLDNATAVSYINKQGDTQAPAVMEVAKLILMWAKENTLSLSAIRLKRELNSLVDFLSRENICHTE